MFLDKIIFYFLPKILRIFFLADLGVLPASLKKKIRLTVFDRLPKGQIVSSKRINFPNFLCPPSPSFSENNVAYDSIAGVGKTGVWLRADFQSGSRVLKKVF